MPFELQPSGPIRRCFFFIFVVRNDIDYLGDGFDLLDVYSVREHRTRVENPTHPCTTLYPKAKKHRFNFFVGGACCATASTAVMGDRPALETERSDNCT